jgi:hypothetical protein
MVAADHRRENVEWHNELTVEKLAKTRIVKTIFRMQNLLVLPKFEFQVFIIILFWYLKLDCLETTLGQKHMNWKQLLKYVKPETERYFQP